MTTCTRYDDAALIRLLDGVPDAADAVEIERHLVACAECARRCERARVRSARLTHLLRLDEGAPPDAEDRVGRARAVPWRGPTSPDDATRTGAVGDRRAGHMTRTVTPTRVAVGLALLAGLALNPLGATIRDWISGRAHETTVATPDEAPVTATSYTFDIVDAALDIRVESPDAIGRVVVVHADVGAGSVRVSGGTGGEEITLVPGRLDVNASRPGRGTLEVTVPTGTTLRVEVDGQSVPPESGDADAGGIGGAATVWTIRPSGP